MDICYIYGLPAASHFDKLFVLYNHANCGHCRVSLLVVFDADCFCVDVRTS